MRQPSNGAESSSATAKQQRRRAQNDLFAAVMLGLFCAALIVPALAALRFDSFSHPAVRWICGFAFAVICVAGMRTKRFFLLHMLWISTACIFLFAGAVGHTSLMQPLMKSLVVRDAATRGDAIVVLSCDVFADGRPVPESQRRLDYSYKLLQQNLASTLVITKLPPPRPSYQPAVKQQLTKLQLQQTQLVEIGPVQITRDEAVQTAQLVKQKGWKRVLVVTDGFHSRRAKALFEGAGLDAMLRPCSNPVEDFGNLQTAEQRYSAFRIWKYETAASWYSKFRGWL
jgi:uncharacterized SAM-binding protein YcdF (DUF218 family)